ncbi:MAG: SpoIIE family protein phosphatase [Bacillota bacterium]
MVTRESASAPGLRRSRWTRLKAKIADRFGWAWQPLLYAGLLFGFLLGRAVPISKMAPFGIAFYVAVRGAGFSGLGVLPVALAVIAGAFTGLRPAQAGGVALAVVVAHVAMGAVRANLDRPRPLQAALLAASVAFIPTTLLSPRPETLQIAFWAGLTGVLTLVFSLGIVDVTRGRFRRVGSSDLPVPAIVMMAAALTGLQGLTLWGWLSVHGAAAGLVVMACAYAGGLALGASAGAVLGIGFFFTAIGTPPPTGPGAGLPLPEAQAMAYVVAGFLAGAFRDLKKPGVGVSYVLAFITYTMATQGLGSVAESMALTAAVAVGLFWLMPREWLAQMPVELVIQQPVEPAGAEEREAPLPEALDRLKSMSQVLKEVQRTFEQVAAVQAHTEPYQRRLLEQATERVCRSCSMYTQCWHRDFDKSYQLFADLWGQIEEEGPLPTAPPPEELERLCIHPEQVTFTLNYLHDIDRSRRAFARRLEEGRAIAGDYIKNVSRLLDRMAEEVAQSGGRIRPTNTPVFKMVTAVARLPKRGGHISGDSYEAAPLSEGRYLMALSDGMGVGGDAAAQSKQCVRLLHQLLDAGFATEVAVKTVNSVLLLRSPDESFATVDLGLLDLGTGRAEFVKVGAAPSFMKRGSDVTVVKMDSVPVGIINQVEVEPEFRNLRQGDIIVMITDGIWDVSKDDIDKERWIIDFLAREQTTSPEELAERLLARTLTLMPVPEDDLTVLVGKVCLVDSGRGDFQAKPARAGQWVPAQVAPRIKPVAPAKGKERRT